MVDNVFIEYNIIDKRLWYFTKYIKDVIYYRWIENNGRWFYIIDEAFVLKFYS